MTQFSNEELVVARQVGGRLLLAGASGMAPTFEGPSHRTIFFLPEEAETDLRRMKVDPETVELRPAKLSIEVE